MTTTRPCVRCRRPMQPQRTQALCVHIGRELCQSCYRGADYRGELDLYERRNYTRDDLMDEWAFLRVEGYTKRQAAARLGVTHAAFDRAYHRARAAGDPRALPAITTGRPPSAHRRTHFPKWARPCWLDIRETHTLSAREAREEADERHLHSLQLDFIERGVRLWSNPGELVVSPFAGIGSEGWMARKLGRRAWMCELKPSYWRQQVANMRALDEELSTVGLFDLDHAAGVPS